MPRETRICLMPQAICFNNSSSVICAVPLAIIAQSECFIQKITMTYLSFQQKRFIFAKNFDIRFFTENLFNDQTKKTFINT